MKKINALVVVLLFMDIAAAANIDRSFESRIIAACVNSVVNGGKNIPNYQAVCKCIGETHYRSAVKEANQREADEHIKWTTEFYETSDMKYLQRLVDRNPKFSSYDDQVVDDCMGAANKGRKK